MDFSLIKDINIDSEFTWKGKVFLTLDMEWASDDSIKYVLDKVISNDAKITIFCTHETPLIDDLKNESRIELGIHPNFNFLLNGDFRYGKSIDDVLYYYKQIVPDCVSVRSHCLTSGSLFLRALSRHGLQFDCSPIIPASAGMLNRPWLSYYDNIIQVPILWEDDIHCMYNWAFHMGPYLNPDRLMVFNFHPVLTVLNIDSLETYEQSKPVYSDHVALLGRRNQGRGTDDMLEELLREVRSSN
jgi:hypothetical protein